MSHGTRAVPPRRISGPGEALDDDRLRRSVVERLMCDFAVDRAHIAREDRKPVLTAKASAIDELTRGRPVKLAGLALTTLKERRPAAFACRLGFSGTVGGAEPLVDVHQCPSSGNQICPQSVKSRFRTIHLIVLAVALRIYDNLRSFAVIAAPTLPIKPS
ncbi:hypothetical protein [Microvirga makkahensis]|uniref:Uncharacterized protein n=1 Tax=Microvirga makkahensis TaxID=1128670 RepID=A0A7X3MN14_9HYPH|nr:hypothetical protein [Microvirga makkahensis]MXQ10081.1 hypothetical protein [Microvirga makkahensis]